jgi:plastocyanin
MHVRGPSLLVALLVGALALAGCSGGAGGGAGGAADDGRLVVVGTDLLRFEPETLSAPAGTITFELVCQPAVNHNLVIEATGEQVAACAPGGTGVGSVELAPGSHVYVCTVPGHEVSMRGTVTVS